MSVLMFLPGSCQAVERQPEDESTRRCATSGRRDAASQIETSCQPRARLHLKSAVPSRTSKAGKKNAAPHASYLFLARPQVPSQAHPSE